MFHFDSVEEALRFLQDQVNGPCCFCTKQNGFIHRYRYDVGYGAREIIIAPKTSDFFLED